MSRRDLFGAKSSQQSKKDGQDEEGEGDDTSSTGSPAEMTLSRDRYAMTVAGAPSAPTVSPTGSGSSASSVGEMTLSQDKYAMTVPGASGGLNVPPPPPGPQFLAKFHRASPSKIPARAPYVRPSPSPPDSGLHFEWGHFGSVVRPFDEPNIAGIFQSQSETESEASHFTGSMIEDVFKLRDIGFMIDYPDGFLGEGFYGQVYRGHYGQSAEGLQSVHQSQPFAVKVIDFQGDTSADARDRRESFETEKYILTTLSHKNVVAVRMIINMGEQRPFPYISDPNTTYMSAERVWMVMDMADGGDLASWLTRNTTGLESFVKISFIRDLFSGMYYLHSHGMAHGDVHTGNVLMFAENISDWVPKWSDFGLGYVAANKQFRFKAAPDSEVFEHRAGKDIVDMSKIFDSIRQHRKAPAPDTQEERDILDKMRKMSFWIRQNSPKDLNVVVEQFRDIVEGELTLAEEDSE